MFDFTLKEGDLLPVLRVGLTLADSGVSWEDASEVRFAWWPLGDEDNEHEAAVASFNTESGVAVYEWQAGDTDVPGEYRGEIRLNLAGKPMTFPNGAEEDAEPYIRFFIHGRQQPATRIADQFNLLRHLLGDHGETQLYEDSSLRNGIQSMIRLGKLQGYALTADRQSITPEITDPNKLALLLYYTVHSFVASRPADASLRTRAWSTSQGNFKDFLRVIEENIYDLEAGTMFGGMRQFTCWMTDSLGYRPRQPEVHCRECVREWVWVRC